MIMQICCGLILSYNFQQKDDISLVQFSSKQYTEGTIYIRGNEHFKEQAARLLGSEESRSSGISLGVMPDRGADVA